MKSAFYLVAALSLAGFASVEAAPIALAEAAKTPGLKCEMTGNGHDELKVVVANASAASVQVEIPGGLVCQASSGERVVVLRGGQLEVAAGRVSEAQMPVAALSVKNAALLESFTLAGGAELRLEPLLRYLATKPDVPKATSQLLVLALLDDVNFAQWQQFLSVQRAGEPAGQTHPTPAEITTAIDALGVLREIAPEKAFALASDAELKLRALRNPWCRAKAMQLYGMTIPGDVAGGTPPDLGQLLHTKPGDNCPICRMRAQMQGPASDL